MDNFFDEIYHLWGSFSVLTAFFVFAAYVVVDMLYAKYTYAVAQLQSARAATTGSLMYFLLAIGVLNYTQNALYLIPLTLGSWIGTYIAVEYERRRKS